MERLVTSSQFAQLWEGALRTTHSRAIAVIQGDPNRALQLFDDGTLTLELSAIIQAVKQVLIDQELRFAERIPEVHRSIPILASDSLVTVRTVYQIAVVAGYWLPWAVLALLVVGIGIARDRARALAWAGAGLAVSLLLLAGGVWVGGRFFTGSSQMRVWAGCEVVGARRSRDERRGLPRMEALTLPIRKTPTCLTLPRGRASLART